MSQMPVEANVVLTTDNTQYDQAMVSSAENTDHLGKAVDGLTEKLNNLSKSAGKKMLGFAAADVAMITAATTAYGAFEKQMSSLNAQAAVLNRTVEGQQRTFNQYTGSVNNLRGVFGTSTQDAAALVQTLSKLGDGTSSVDKLATTFTKMGSATGESVNGLAQSVLQLQKTMGTPQRDTERYANQLTVLATRANTSAGAIADFAQQIAPVGRMVNMSQTDIQGISTAFIKAGQDGYQAAGAFNKMMSDVAYASQTGSPDLAKYANLVGMTVEQFKSLGGTDQYIKMFEAINRQGPQAITTLNRMGLDGMRTQRAVTALAQQGGPGAEIAAARNADPGAMARGSEAAMKGLFETLGRVRSELAMTAEAFGAKFAPAAEKFLSYVEKIAGVVRSAMQGPLGDMAAAVAGMAAPFAALGGTVLIAAKALSTFSAASLLLRGSFNRGFGEGRQGFGRDAAGMWTGQIGQRMDSNGSWVQKPMYAAGNRMGSIFHREGQPQTAGRYSQWLDRNTGGWFLGAEGERGDARREKYGVRPTPGLMSRGLGYGLAGVGFGAKFLGDQFSPMWWGVPGKNGMDDPTQRGRIWNKGSIGDYKAMKTLNAKWQQLGMHEQFDVAGTGSKFKDLINPSNLAGFASMRNNPPKSWDEFKEAIKETAAKDAATTKGKQPFDMDKFKTDLSELAGDSGIFESVKSNSKDLADDFKKTRKETMDLGRGMGSASRGLGSLMGSLTMASGGALKAGAGMLGRGALGLGTAIFGGPVGLGLAGVAGAFTAWNAIKDKTEGNYKDTSGFANPYLAAGGITSPASLTPTGTARRTATTMYEAYNISQADINAANAKGYELSNPELKGKSREEVINRLLPQFDLYKSNAGSMDTLTQDLLSMFSQKETKGIISSLRQGKGYDPGMYISKSLNQEGSFWRAGGESRDDVIAPLNELGGVFADRARMIGATYGPEAEAAEQAKQLKQSITMFSRQGGLGMGYQKNTEREQFAKFLGNQFGLESLTGEELNAATSRTAKYGGVQLIDPQATSRDDQFRSFLGNAVFNGGKGMVTVSRDDQQQLLNRFGVDENLTGDAAIDAIMKAMTQDYSRVGLQDDPNSLAARIAALPGMTNKRGDALFASDAVTTALSEPENVNAQIKGIKNLLGSMQKMGKTAAEINTELGNVRATAVSEGEPEYQLAMAAQQFNAKNLGYRMADMNRTDQFAAQTAMFHSNMSIAEGDEHEAELQEQAKDEYFGQVQAQKQYFVQLLTQQREFNISRARGEEDFELQRERMEQQYDLSRSRAQDDFDLQRKYQEFDFNLQRERAEQQYNISRHRGEENFQRSMRRGRADFNLSRLRQEQDFNHQVEMMVKQAAQSVYNIYDRMQVQRTSSAEWLLHNASDQLQAMEEQSANLRKMRRMGMSDDAIQQLGLTDANNAQQLARLVSDVAENPEMVREFNQAVGRRLKAAKSLVTDESSQQWQEFNRQHRIARQRGEEDFQRSVRRSMMDFRIQMNQMERDFRRSMNQQAADYERAQDRQQEAFDLSMDRSAEDYDTAIGHMVDDFGKQMDRASRDLNRAAKTIDGTMEEILLKSVKRLSGHARNQAQSVLDSFTGLKDLTTPVAVDIMTTLAEIFGVNYNAPKSGGQKNSRGNTVTTAAEAEMEHGGPSGRGGGGGGGSAAPSAHVPLPAGTYTTGYNEWGDANSRYAKGYHTGDDYAAAAGTPILAALPGKVSLAGDGGAYGNLVVIDHGGGLQTYYAHQSHMGVQVGDSVRAGQRIGSVGSTGNSDGAHLHFEVRMNGVDVDPDSLGRLATGRGVGSYGGTSTRDVLQKRYAGLERLTAGMSGLNVLGDGDISAIINRFGRQAIRRMERMSGSSLAEAGTTSGNLHVGEFEVPQNVKGNVELGKKMAADLKGWKGAQWNALYKLWTQESGWRTNADNPTSSAYGIPQALIALHKMPKGYYDSTAGSGAATQGFGGDPRVQIGWGLNYIANNGNFNDPISAWKFHQANNWYGDGAIFDGGARTIGVGERGPELVMPLNEKGVDFIALLMARMHPGLEAKNAHTRGYAQPATIHTMHSYQIDRSTTFSGNITVQANNPNEFITQLRHRERTRALTQPAIGGRKI